MVQLLSMHTAQNTMKRKVKLKLKLTGFLIQQCITYFFVSLDASIFSITKDERLSIGLHILYDAIAA